MKKRTLTLVVALVLVSVMAVGGTLAWLTAQTQTVTNTFTVGDIDITLTETDSADEDNNPNNNEYQIIPGTNIAKDPKVSVDATSEACWLFVKVTEANWPAVTEKDANNNDVRKINYVIDSKWKELEVAGLEAGTKVYYCEIAKGGTAEAISVLANDVVTVSGSLTKTEIEAITVEPTLTFKAYAVQRENIATAEAAWASIPAAEK